MRSRPIRKRLLRRIANGTTCGHQTTDGSPCLAAQVAPGSYCQRHGGKPKPPDEPQPGHVKTGANASMLSLAWLAFGQHLPPEEQIHFKRLLDTPTDCLDDQIAMVRIRLAMHTRRFTAGHYTVEQFEKYTSACSAEIRQLVEANMRVRAAKIAIDKETLAEQPQDAWEPLAPHAGAGT